MTNHGYLARDFGTPTVRQWSILSEWVEFDDCLADVWSTRPGLRHLVASIRPGDTVTALCGVLSGAERDAIAAAGGTVREV